MPTKPRCSKVRYMKKLLGYILLAMTMLSCASDLENGPVQEGSGIIVSASCAGTKSVLSPDLSVVWNAEDRITALSLDGKASSVSNPCGTGGSSCDFVFPNWIQDAEPRYAVFGGSSDKPCAEINGRYVRASIPVQQKISDEGSFARDANISVGEILKAASGGYEVQMKNVCGLIRFSLENFDNVKYVTLFDKTSKAELSGKFDIFLEDGVPVIKGVAAAANYITVSMMPEAGGESVFPIGKSFYICVRPGVDFTPEFVLSLTDGTTMVHSADANIMVRRSTVVDCGVVDADVRIEENRYPISNENFVGGGNFDDFAEWEEKLAEGYHPRLIFTQKEFDRLKGMVNGNDALSKLHGHLMSVADESVADTEKLVFKLDASNKRILDVSRDALARLVSCAYAYKMTGLSKYSDKAVQDLTDVCSFSSWNPSHYLDVAEMSAAVSIAYDWLYDVLAPSLRSKVVSVLKSYALDTSRKSGYNWWYDRVGNWNQVCNGGLVCAAVAVYEYYPTLAQAVIDDAVRTNRLAVEGIYGPDGAYPEGPTYWNYGTMYQVLMLTVLEDVFYTDYGISSAPGFLQTGRFKIFTQGSLGMNFNYADNTTSSNSNYPLYYLAYESKDPSMLYNEMHLLENDTYTGSDHKGLLPLAIKYAMQMDLSDLRGPEDKFYAAQGNVPVMMCRSGWDSKDQYLGIKGGQDGYLHGHMDGGSFVYYAHGVRWGMDYVRQNYADVENGIADLGGKLSDYTQNSLRWRLFRLNCRQHNTLTVNDKDHNVEAFVRMIATENTSSRMGATFDLTPLFDGDLAKAHRTAALCDEEYLEVKDVLKAPDSKPAHVRWTMVSKATPQITDDGIILTRKSVSVKLRTEGGKVTYREWSSDPLDYDSPLKHLDAYDSDSWICGYEIDIPAGQELTLVTTLKKL